MPADLFRTSVQATPVRRRASLLPLSIAAHVVAIAVAVIAPLFAEVDLPEPRRASLEYMRVEMPAPPPEPAPVAARRAASAANPNAAPLEAPPDVLPETASQNFSPAIGEGLVEGVFGQPGGVPGAVPLGDVALPPAPPAKPQGPMRVGGKIRAPQRIFEVRPVYPSIAQRAHVQGKVIVEAIIGVDGRVEETRVVDGKPLLNDAAVAAVRQWRFTPTLLNGQPVPVVMTVTVEFRLQ